MRLLNGWTGVLVAALLGVLWTLPSAPLRGAAQADLRELSQNSRDGHVRIELEPEKEPAYADLLELAKASDVIVIARAAANRCRLTRDGQSIVTVYEMNVLEVFRGRADLQRVSVEIPGGWLEFSPGHSAEVVVPWFLPMSNQEQYLLFLSPAHEGVFKATGGAQGIFGLTWDYVQVHSGKPGDPIWRYAGMEVSDLIAMLKRELESQGR